MENLDRTSCLSDQNRTPLALPIYQGSIIRIDPNEDDEKMSDLIVRVPNFHHWSLPCMATNEDQRAPRIKRRAPYCPHLAELLSPATPFERNTAVQPDNENSNQKTSAHERLTHMSRLAAGLRHLTRVLANGHKVKRSSSENPMMFVPMLPDVEIMNESFEVLSLPKEEEQSENSTPTGSKLLSPKLFCIKRKYFKSKRKPSSSASSDTQIDLDPEVPPTAVDQHPRDTVRFEALDAVSTESENDGEPLFL